MLSISPCCILEWLDEHHITCDVVALSLLAASCYRNWFWRVVCIGASAAALSVVPGVSGLPNYARVALAGAILLVPPLKIFDYFRDQPEEGCVFVTGADSGMGEATVLHLVHRPYEVIYAGCFLAASEEKLKAKVRESGGDVSKIVTIQLDVTDDKSVAAAAATVEADMQRRKPTVGLISLINCAGMAYNGPAEYIPIEIYQKQLDVNFLGYVRVFQAFMPLVREATVRSPFPPNPGLAREHPLPDPSDS